MKTVERICAHDVEFCYFSRSPRAVPDEAEIEHVETLIRENYIQGELCLVVTHPEHEFRGWWRILPS